MPAFPSSLSQGIAARLTAVLPGGFTVEVAGAGRCLHLKGEAATTVARWRVPLSLLDLRLSRRDGGI